MNKCLNTIFCFAAAAIFVTKTIAETIAFSSTRRNNDGQHWGARLPEPPMPTIGLNNFDVEQSFQGVQCPGQRVEQEDCPATKLPTIVGKFVPRGQDVLVYGCHNRGVQWHGTRWSATILRRWPPPTRRMASTGLFAQCGRGFVFLSLAHV